MVLFLTALTRGLCSSVLGAGFFSSEATTVAARVRLVTSKNSVGVGLHIGALYMCHGWCLLLWEAQYTIIEIHSCAPLEVAVTQPHGRGEGPLGH